MHIYKKSNITSVNQFNMIKTWFTGSSNRPTDINGAIRLRQTWVVSTEMKDLSPGDTAVPFSYIFGTSS